MPMFRLSALPDVANHSLLGLPFPNTTLSAHLIGYSSVYVAGSPTPPPPAQSYPRWGGGGRAQSSDIFSDHLQ